MHPDQLAREKQLRKKQQEISTMIEQLNKLKDIHSDINDFGPKVRVQALTKNAIIPTRTNPTDAGWDLYASEDAIIYESKRKVVKTGIALQIPKEWVGLIWPRSGLSAKKGLDVLAGVIDSGYRGEIMVCLQNTNPQEGGGFNNVVIKKGDRIAQILFQQVPDVTLVPVDELTSSDRGEDGFGSSGE